MPEANVEEPQQLPLQEPHVQEPAPAAEQDAESPEVVALRTQVLDAQRRESEANAQRDAANARFDQYLERSPQQSAPATQRIDPLNAPDPAVEPEAFQRHQAAVRAQDQRDIDQRLSETAQRIEKTTQSGIDQIQAEQRAQRLWGEFQSTYPEHAHQERIATLAFNDLYSSGMPSDTSGVLAAVKTKMEEMIGTPTPAPNRTGGVSGGSPPPRTPTPPAEPSGEPLSMVEIMQQRQLDEGII